MRCEHNKSVWAAFVSPSGGIFHVCLHDWRPMLHLGAPGPGFGPSWSTSRDAKVAVTVIPLGFMPIGWAFD